MDTKDAGIPLVKSKEFREALIGAAYQNNAIADDVSIIVHENKVPSFLGKILDELYGSVFSSVSHLEVYESLHNANTYIAVRKDRVIAALLFRHEQHEITVINETFQISKEEMARFTGYIFSTYQSVKKITFNATSSEAGKIGHPVQRFPDTKHIIVSLPLTEEEYTARLGKATRKSIKHRINQLKRTFPSFSHEVQEGENISEEDLLAIIGFNRMRMAEKHKIFHLDQEAIARIVKLAKRCGFISVIRLDGRVCAGAICYQAGKMVMSHVNAHDPEYNQYRLGTLSCYLAICESIRRKAKEFNLQWGEEEYKYALLGVDRPFDRILIYRSYLHLFSDSKTILQIKAGNRLRSIKMWLIAQSKRDTYSAKCINSCIALVKRKKYSNWHQQHK